MDHRCCLECGDPLKGSEIKNSQKRCGACLSRRHVALLLAEDSLSHTFSKRWARELFSRLGLFLQSHQIPLRTQAGLLSKAALLLQEAESQFGDLAEITPAWLEAGLKKMGKHVASSFFKAFLFEEHLLSKPGGDEKALKALLAKLEQLPAPYRRAMQVYFNERLALRERQIKEHASRPLALKTLVSDLEMLSRLVRWLLANQPELSGWDMVQEEQIQAFLLTLTPKNREVVRKDLHQFFRLARKRRFMTHVPLTDSPSKELPQTAEPLVVEEQKTLARLIRQSTQTHPEEALLAALCFYHGLASSQICHLKTSHVDVEQARILVERRPPVYLLAEDMLLLEQFLRKRQELPYAKSRSHLFISHTWKLDDEPVRKGYICDKVQAFCGQTPQCLRITCFAALSARYGPQYLVEAFGLSLTQASRYAKMQEFLIEEEVKQQREEFVELSRQLGRQEKPSGRRPANKKGEGEQGDHASQGEKLSLSTPWLHTDGDDVIEQTEGVSRANESAPMKSSVADVCQTSASGDGL